MSEFEVLPFDYPSLPADACRRFETFAQLLQDHNRRVNLTAITDIDGIYRRHFADSLAVLPTLDNFARSAIDLFPTCSLADLGSGPGLPGLAIAIARPTWQITSIEATGKKARFQQTVIDSLQLNNATVISGRIEELAHDDQYRESFSVVTARALAELRILLELAAGFLKPAGILIAWKTVPIDAELDAAQFALDTLGLRFELITPYTLPGEIPSASSLCLLVIKKIASTDSRFPRSFSKLKSQPL
ncbi:MAG: 16S rRNA (guanine(527)-N(7))-methyltransferase RsmG [Phycisphaerae bacterium]|nr:16S rRNA (guanine(527)-N(7))-methyltransferase RsmG [Phycisphaerae bacterium]